MPQNVPALWRYTKFYSFNYPIANVASVHGIKGVQVELKKYLTGDSDFLSRMFIRISGPIVVAGAGVGVATGKDSPGTLLTDANLKTSPSFAQCVPINAVSSRGLHMDGMLNAGGANTSDPQAWGGSTPLTDAVGTQQVNLYTEFIFARSPLNARGGVEYSLPLAKYTSTTLNLNFGGRDQFFTGGVNTWDLSGLTVDLYAEIDTGLQPDYIHAHELFENSYPIVATSKDFKIDNLPSGFVYTDLAFVTEDANAPVNTILNNVAIFNGANAWFSKGENNADALRYAFASRNDRLLQSPQNVTGLYAIPVKDRMFTRAFDARFSPLTISLDVTSISATSNIRLVGRRMLPGGIYSKPKAAGK